MITVKIIREYDHQIRSITISGHANSGPYGHDLVCAGVSAVSFGLVNAILTLAEENLTIEQAEDEGGYLHVEIPPQSDQVRPDDVQLLLAGMVISLQTIEHDYKEYIQIVNG